MALTPAEIESAAPNAWTGKPSAVVYETAEDVALWLTSKRNLNAFDTLSLPEQEAALVEVTEDAEEAVRPWFRGRPQDQAQGLLLPARGAYDSSLHLMVASGDLPALERSIRSYLEGIRLLAEEVPAGTYMQLATPGAQLIKEEGKTIERTVYREGSDPTSLKANHPAAYRKLRAIIPRIG